MSTDAPKTAKPLDPRKRKDLQGTVDQLKNQEGILGASLIDRMGGVLVSRGESLSGSDMLHPLLATLAGAGHQAVAEIDEKPDVRVVAKSDRKLLHIAGVDDDHLLVTVADSAKPWENIRPRVNEARKTLRQILADG